MGTHYGQHFQVFMCVDKLLNLSLGTQKTFIRYSGGYSTHKRCLRQEELFVLICENDVVYQNEM